MKARVVLLLLVAACAGQRARLSPATTDPGAAALGLQLAPGFRIAQFADGALANDLYALAIDSRGQVVVSSKGWIKRLVDRDGDGRADEAPVIATTKSGSMGLAFVDDDLYSFQDGGLWRYPGGGGTPQKILDGGVSEHGGHILRKGADGFLYLIGGNQTGFKAEQVNAPRSPIRRPEWGGLMRISPDGKTREMLSDGLRNPYRFDFTADGEAIAYEANGERDVFLPWYLPTRLFHLAHGGHHGWLMPNWQRSFARPDDAPDAIPILRRMGEGSPTATICYRHTQLPERYRGGLFLADWTFGRLSYLPLGRAGATYAPGELEVILEAVGTEGFAPSDAAVAPDGSIFLAIGGRGTRGAVYRLWWADGAAEKPASPLDRVLRAPQPLDAWSRAVWEPIARKLGPAPFVEAASSDRVDAPSRVRAIEVLTELFAGIPREAAPALAASPVADVRRRVAWSLGRKPWPSGEALLLALGRDREPAVKTAAVEALADSYPDAPAFAALVSERLGDKEDKGDKDGRTRRAATWAASVLPDAAWRDLVARAPDTGPLRRLGVALASAWRLPDGRAQGFASAPAAQRDAAIETALVILKDKPTPELVTFAVRILVLAFGDWKIDGAPAEVFVPYNVRNPPPAAVAARILDVTVPLFPTGDARTDEELARLFAVLEARDPKLPARIAAKWTQASATTADLHYLIVLARLRGARPAALTRQTADALFAMYGKLGVGAQRMLQNWELRVVELLGELIAHDAHLAPVVAQHASLVDPAQLALAAALSPAHRLQVARRLLTLLPPKGKLPFTETVLSLIGELPPAESRPLLRDRFADEGLRDAVLLALAKKPEADDRARFLIGLGSFQAATVDACLRALDGLGRSGSPDDAIALLRLQRRLLGDPAARPLRQRVQALLERELGHAFKIDERGTTRADLQQAYQPLYDWFVERHPDARKRLGDEGEEDPAAFAGRLRAVPWTAGDRGRGETVARARACLACHAGSHPFGPTLAGSAKRMSREDLMAAIAYPNRDVSQVYRPLYVQVKTGESYNGLVVYQSPDVLILRTGPETSVRLPGPEITVQRHAEGSLMPAGLLEGLSPNDLADVYAYLRTLE